VWGITNLFINLSSILFPAWVSYLNIGVLIGTLALALFNASKDDVARNFAYFYAVVSVGIIVSIFESSSNCVVLTGETRLMVGSCTNIALV